MNERLEAVVRGRVQGVMYRDFAMRHARRLSLVGTVRNERDGTVHVIVEGPRAALEEYVHRLSRGPLLARVDGVDVRYAQASGAFASFDIRYD